MKSSKYAMQAVGYFLLSVFEQAEIEHPGSVQRMINKVGYVEYHNFWKCRIPLRWYKEILDPLDLTSNDLLVEIARIKGNHAKDLHYHKISHAICIVLGNKTGFKDTPYDSAVQIGQELTMAYEDLECYFPTGCYHTFYGSYSDVTDDGDLYFISIQSPPLLTEDNDDFYWVQPR